MTTWAALLVDEVGERLKQIRWMAATLSAVLHGVIVLAAFAELPWRPVEASEAGVDVTIELALRADDASFGKAVGPVMAPEPPPESSLLLREPAPGDTSSPPDSPDSMPVPESVASEMEAPIEAPREAQHQEASTASTPAPAEPELEKLLAPVEAPPTVEAQDFARARPATAAAPAQQQKAQAPAALSPPAKRATQEANLRAPSGAAGPAPAAPPRSDRGQQKAEEDYFWQIVRKISQYRFYAAQQSVERGLVVTSMTIGRDGRLLDVALVKSSGFPNLDKAVVDTIRQASPFAPLPADLAQDRKTFVVPVNYTREH